jgi:hypothetical protein
MSVAVSDFTANNSCPKYDPTDPANGQKQIYVQLVLSLALGLTAFFGFCVSLVVVKQWSAANY